MSVCCFYFFSLRWDQSDTETNLLHVSKYSMSHLHVLSSLSLNVLSFSCSIKYQGDHHVALHRYSHTNRFKKRVKQLSLTKVISRGTTGCQPPRLERQPNVLQKLHKHERNWTERGFANVNVHQLENLQLVCTFEIWISNCFHPCKCSIMFHPIVCDCFKNQWRVYVHHLISCGAMWSWSCCMWLRRTNFFLGVTRVISW